MKKYSYSKNKHCKCGKLITNKAGNCVSCATKKRFIIIEESPSFKHGKYCKDRINHCIDCLEKGIKTEISPLAIRCPLCANSGKNHPNYKDGRSNKKYFCIDCEERISWKTAINGKGRCLYCSNSKDKNPNWNNGSSFEPYSLEWTEELRKFIRKRDNFICQNCGMTEEEHIIIYGRILTIHHIDYDKKNCNKNNLITLCCKCNSIANQKTKKWKKFYTNKMKIL